jgi:hypothetical protein
MLASLFNVSGVRMFRLEIGKEDEYGHFFGRPAIHQGVAMRGFPPEDPRIGVRIPGVKWLPLYHAFRSIMCYRVLSDVRVKMLNEPYSKKDLPRNYLDDFPLPFRRVPVRLIELKYDPRDAEDVYFYGGIFGIDMLNAAERRAVKRGIQRKFRRLLPADEELEDDRIHLVGGIFPQGYPHRPCPNKSCPNAGAAGNLHTLFSLSFDDEDKNRQRNDPSAVLDKELAGVHLIYQICPLCLSLDVTGQCT